MSIKFTDLQGKATKSGPERFKPVDGENRFRIVGSVIPAYKYWLQTRDGSSVPMECLSFDREKEKFDNRKTDMVRKYFPEKKCSWAYASYVIDRSDGKLKLFDHKKKLFESILDVAKKKFGDPTNVENGWDIVFSRKRTGPKVYNVEYILEVFDLENSALSEEDKKMVEEAEPIETITVRQTPEEQETFIKTYILDDTSNEPEEEELLSLNNIDDDISM